ncbi:MAG: chitobiase/beta-hexosaminidase C-terminal domain-containing protein [Proteobacteria bacterium]|nr:chitobiase/beta-hexosaminidase C-terminal domain-containing protein [Pseudomonadota bacterium]
MKNFFRYTSILSFLILFASCASGIHHAKHWTNQTDNNTGTPGDNSSVAQLQVEAPTMDIDTGSYSLDINITINSATPGVAIYYTTNGQDPTTASDIYSAPISIKGDGTSKTIKALAVKDGMSNSNVVNKNYVINYSKVSTPSISPTAGTYSNDQNIVITCLTEGVEIHYTIDDTTPSSSSPLYTRPFTVSSTVTVKAIALKSQMSNSDVSTDAYAVVTPVIPGLTCDDLKAINQILFITFTYDKKYDLNNDGEITIQDKLIIERNLLENNAACVTVLRTCDDLQAVKDQIQNWSEVQAFASVAYFETIKSAIAYSIIFNESGQNCANDFNTGSFVGDVNKNGYLECNDPVYIERYVAGLSVDPFEPLLADINASHTFTALDALLDKIVLIALFTNYMDNLGECPQ